MYPSETASQTSQKQTNKQRRHMISPISNWLDGWIIVLFAIGVISCAEKHVSCLHVVIIENHLKTLIMCMDKSFIRSTEIFHISTLKIYI